MEKLKKSDRRRFDDVCRKIREALHLEHWKYYYEFTDEKRKDADDRDTLMSFHSQIGRRIHVEIGPYFWDTDAEEQLRGLLHEHIHALQNGYLHVVKEIINKAVHESEWKQWEDRFKHANEQSTDHLESVLYDLLKDRF